MGAVRAVLAIPAIRRLEASWFGGNSASYGALVAASVYAFAAGGAGAVALFGVLRTLPALVLTPIVTSVADRIPRERLLLWTVLIRSVALALAAVAILARQPLLVVLLLASAEGALLGVQRPAHNALLLWLARTPAELTAANVVSSILEGTAVFAGPVLVGIVLAVSGPAAAMGVAAALMAGGAAALAGLRVGGQQAPARVAGHRVRQVVDDLVGGLRAYPATPGTSALLALAFAQTVVRGALSVLIVLLAVDVLGIGEAGVGWLNAAIGFGGLAGGLLAVRVVRDRWLARWAALGVAGWGLPLVAFAVLDSAPAALALLALVGVANAVLDVAAFTALQRSLPSAAIGRALGVLETVAFVGIGLGAALTPVALSMTDVPGVLVAAGLLLVAAAAAAWPAVTVIDRGLVLPGPEVALLRGLPMFAPLPLVTVQHLATRLQEARYEDGAVVIAEGEPGELFHVIAEGAAVASVAGRPLRTMGPGDGFGEIALLRDVPRTATVSARGPLRTVTLHRADFLAALAVNVDSAAAADALATGRLGTDSWSGPRPEPDRDGAAGREPRPGPDPLDEEPPDPSAAAHR
jgi:predicted MFS family arabinose efflux permease